MFQLNARNLVILSSPRSGSHWYARLLYANLVDQGFELLSELFNPVLRSRWMERVDERTVQYDEWVPNRFKLMYELSPEGKIEGKIRRFDRDPDISPKTEMLEYLKLLEHPSPYRYIIKEILPSVRLPEALWYLTTQSCIITHRRDKWAQLLSMLIAAHTRQWVREQGVPPVVPKPREIRSTYDQVVSLVKAINVVTAYRLSHPDIPCVYYEDMFVAPENALSLIGLSGSLSKAESILPVLQLGDGVVKEEFFDNIDEIRDTFEERVLKDG